MNVRELVEELSKLDPDMNIQVHNKEFDGWNEITNASYLQSVSVEPIHEPSGTYKVAILYTE